MKKQSRILIVGHNDVVEHALAGHFLGKGYADVHSASRIKLDVFNQSRVAKFFAKERPEYVFLASTRSGGIEANQKYAAEFIYSNLASQNHVVHSAYQSGVKKLLFIASSCIYPKESAQPIREESLLTGALEPTSEPYAVAKIAGVKLCQAYRRQYGFKAIAMVPATLYGPGSDTDPKNAHVLGALLAKFHAAVERNDKEVVLWGSGKPRREFLFFDDFVAACVFLMERYDGPDLINAGAGGDVAVKVLAGMIAAVVGFKGTIIFDASKPDGAMRKLLDSRRMRKLGWRPRVELKQGIEETYAWYKTNVKRDTGCVKRCS